MSNQIFRTSVTVITLLTLCAAPALQAFSFAGGLAQMEKSCGCDCCGTPAEESSCPVKSQMSENSCPCSVGEQLPFNSKPIESSVPVTIGKNLAVQPTVLITYSESLNNSDYNIVCFEISPKSHPPLYILHGSWLI